MNRLCFRACQTVLLVTLLLGLGGTASRAQTPLIAEGDPPSLFLLYTGDVIGYLDTCGCKKNPAGGLARRAWVTEQLRERFPGVPILLADSGNYSDAATPEGDLKTAALLTGMERMGYRVVNIGEREIRMGYDDFHERTRKSGLTFVSANLVRQDTQQPIFAPHALIELAPREGKRKIKVGVVGALRYNPLFLKAGPDGSNMVIAQPVERVEREVAALREKGAEVIVLLAALHKDDATQIAQQVPGIDYIVGSYAGQYTDAPETVGTTKVVYSGNMGKWLGETRLFLEDGHVERDVTHLHFLTATYPADQKMLTFVNSVPLKPPAHAAPASADGGQ